MKLKIIDSLFTVTLMILICLAIISVRTHFKVKNLQARVILLEKKAKATVEIHVERAFDADMGVYDYQLCSEASASSASKIKRGRKRMSQLREDY